MSSIHENPRVANRLKSPAGRLRPAPPADIMNVFEDYTNTDRQLKTPPLSLAREGLLFSGRTSSAGGSLPPPRRLRLLTWLGYLKRESRLGVLRRWVDRAMIEARTGWEADGVKGKPGTSGVGFFAIRTSATTGPAGPARARRRDRPPRRRPDVARSRRSPSGPRS